MPETITDHSKDSQLGTPGIPASATVFSIHATTRISAPAALVFRTLRNTDTWRDWNKFCPSVTMLYQPPEADDEATLSEIQELVRNTSVAGSVDSAITDGAASSGGGLIGRRMSVEEEDDIRLSPPPVTKPRLRASIASQGSTGRPSTGSGRPKAASIDSGDNSASAMAALAVANVNAATGLHQTNGQDHARNHSDASTTAKTNGASSPLSAAQKFQQSQETRKASMAAGETPEPPKNVLVEAPHDSGLLVPVARTPANEQVSKAQKNRNAGLSPAVKKRLSINAIYGEPSVRIQIGTRLNLHLRRKVITGSLGTDRDLTVIIDEVSRPEDNEDALPSFNNNPAILINDDGDVNEEGMRAVARMQTHIPAKQPGVYRIVWSMATTYSPPRSYPKWMLQGQRVHEIRRVIRGDGKEECVYEDWECWRGMMASRTEKKNKKYWEERARNWGLGLGNYAEALGGDVERRDFVSR